MWSAGSAQAGAAGVHSRGHWEHAHPNRLRSFLPALSAEAPLKGQSFPGCPRLSPNIPPPPSGPSLATRPGIGSRHYLSGTARLLSGARAQVFPAIRSPYSWSCPILWNLPSGRARKPVRAPEKPPVLPGCDACVASSRKPSLLALAPMDPFPALATVWQRVFSTCGEEYGPPQAGSAWSPCCRP